MYKHTPNSPNLTPRENQCCIAQPQYVEYMQIIMPFTTRISILKVLHISTEAQGGLLNYMAAPSSAWLMLCCKQSVPERRCKPVWCIQTEQPPTALLTTIPQYRVVWQKFIDTVVEPVAFIFCAEFWSTRFLWNIYKFLPNYTVSHVRQ